MTPKRLSLRPQLGKGTPALISAPETSQAELYRPTLAASSTGNALSAHATLWQSGQSKSQAHDTNPAGRGSATAALHRVFGNTGEALLSLRSRPQPLWPRWEGVCVLT